MQIFTINVKKMSNFYFLVEEESSKIYAYSKHTLCVIFMNKIDAVM